MSRLLAGRRQGACGRLSLVAAAIAMIAFPQPVLGQQSGQLLLKKVVIDPLHIQPTTKFRIEGHCGPSMAFAVFLANGETHQGLGAGGTCTITEPSLPPPFTAPDGKACTWLQLPPFSQTVTVGNAPITVTVVNTYQCQSGTGVLKVTKLVTGSLSTQPTAQFQIGEICPTATAYQLTNPLSHTSLPKPYGMVCQVIESQLPPPFVANGQNCVWYRVSPQTQTVTISSPVNLVTVHNSYQCQGGQGMLVVKKVVTGPLSVQPTTQFRIGVVCSASVGQSILLANGGSRTFPGINIGTTCVISEPNLPPPFMAPGAQACTWSPVPTQTVLISGVTQTVTVTNSYTCTTLWPAPPKGH